MIRECTTSDINQIVDLTFAKNNEPEHNCAYCYKDYNYIRKDFVSMMEAKDKVVIGFNCRNQEYLVFMDAIHAENQGNECWLTLKRENYINKDYGINIVQLPAEHVNDFVNLHDAIFPDAYVSGKDVINSIGHSRKVFCIIENGMLIGYGVLKYKVDSLRADAEIIAIDKKHRGKGYGRAILKELAKQAFYGENVKFLI